MADRRIIHRVPDPVHPSLIEHAERLYFELEHEQLLIHHPAAPLLAFPRILRLMDRGNRPLARHKVIFAQNHLRQDLRNQIPKLRNALGNGLS
ncbi:hypothetical protein D3C73_1106910 [compost metagenome]